MKRNKTLTATEYKEKVEGWLRTGKTRNATHVIIAFDTNKNIPFLVYIGRGINVQQKIKSFNDNDFVNAVEVYDMTKDITSQLAQARTWNA